MRRTRRTRRAAKDRLDRELDIIVRTGTASYFLTVADIADRIKARGIRCAIRGSGAGSFVNHLLGISAIDPLEHGLLMERFLSPVRATLPDIDLDVESARRLDAYRVIFDRYGAERAACVSMMETYRARSAIRAVAAAMSLPPDEIGRIAKAFPHIRARHITGALEDLPELASSNLSAPQFATVFQIAERLDGLPRHVAMHPCGILLSDATLLDRTAVQRSSEGFALSHLDKDDAEIAGVIKLDVLGVRMQSAMAYTIAEIARTSDPSREVASEALDLDKIPRDDEPTYAMIKEARTLGCFQIESPGQRELVRKLAPETVSDLIVDISLFRPGPVSSDMISPFLKARHGLEQPAFPHPDLREALAETGGVVVFHEQVLRILDVMTGCGLAEADLVRRHLSKDEGPRRTKPWFRAAARRRGYDEATIDQRVAGDRRVRRLRLLQGACRRVRGSRLPVGLAQASPPGRLLCWRAHPRPWHVPQARDRRRRPAGRHPCPPARRQRVSRRLADAVPGDPGLAAGGQGHQRRRGHADRRRAAVHVAPGLLGAGAAVPPGSGADGAGRCLRLGLLG